MRSTPEVDQISTSPISVTAIAMPGHSSDEMLDIIAKASVQRISGRRSSFTHIIPIIRSWAPFSRGKLFNIIAWEGRTNANNTEHSRVSIVVSTIFLPPETVLLTPPEEGVLPAGLNRAEHRNGRTRLYYCNQCQAKAQFKQYQGNPNTARNRLGLWLSYIV